jgi:hypothetical protein
LHRKIKEEMKTERNGRSKKGKREKKKKER